MSIQVYKYLRGGYYAETRIHAPLISDNARLVIHTMKRNSGRVSTVARIERRESTGMVVFMPFSDFNAIVLTDSCRATQNNIAKMHQQALNMTDAIMAQALAFYENKQAA